MYCSSSSPCQTDLCITDTLACRWLCLLVPGFRAARCFLCMEMKSGELVAADKSYADGCISSRCLYPCYSCPHLSHSSQSHQRAQRVCWTACWYRCYFQSCRSVCRRVAAARTALAPGPRLLLIQSVCVSDDGRWGTDSHLPLCHDSSSL